MAFATGAKHSAFFVSESTYGVAPTTPTLTVLPHTAFNPNHTRDVLVSGKLRSDRQIEDARLGNHKISPSVKGELEYGSYDALLEAALMGTWTTNVLKTGLTRRSFMLERLLDLDTDEYHRYLGSEITGLSLSVKPGSMVEIDFDFLSKSVTLAASAIAGSTYSAALDRKPFDSFTGSINVDGSAIAHITEVSLKLENGLAAIFGLFSPYTIRSPELKSNLTGSFTSYYESKSMYEKFINETEMSIDFTLTDTTGSDLTFDMPRILLTSSGAPEVSGDGGVTVQHSFQALYNSSDASQIIITRAP